MSIGKRALVRAGRILGFAGYFLGRLVIANLVVAREILTPANSLAPGIIDLPLRCQTPAEIAMLANLLSLTPGTLAIEVDNDPRTLYVHGMHAADPERFLAELRKMEDGLLGAMRPVARWPAEDEPKDGDR